MTVRPLTWLCGHGPEMLLILEKKIRPGYSPIDSDMTVQRNVPRFYTRSICGWNLFQPLGLEAGRLYWWPMGLWCLVILARAKTDRAKIARHVSPLVTHIRLWPLSSTFIGIICKRTKLYINLKLVFQHAIKGNLLLSMQHPLITSRDYDIIVFKSLLIIWISLFNGCMCLWSTAPNCSKIWSVQWCQCYCSL